MGGRRRVYADIVLELVLKACYKELATQSAKNEWIRLETNEASTEEFCRRSKWQRRRNIIDYSPDRKWTPTCWVAFKYLTLYMYHKQGVAVFSMFAPDCMKKNGVAKRKLRQKNLHLGGSSKQISHRPQRCSALRDTKSWHQASKLRARNQQAWPPSLHGCLMDPFLLIPYCQFHQCQLLTYQRYMLTYQRYLMTYTCSLRYRLYATPTACVHFRLTLVGAPKTETRF